MDKGDYINIIKLNRVSDNQECNWRFDTMLPPPFGKQSSNQIKQFNRDLFALQFPVEEGVRGLHKQQQDQNSQNIKRLSIAGAYKRHLREEREKNRYSSSSSTFNSPEFPSAPAWSLGSRCYTPERPETNGNQIAYDISKGSKIISTRRNAPAYTLGPLLNVKWKSESYKEANGIGLTHQFPSTTNKNSGYSMGMKTAYGGGLGAFTTASPGPNRYNISTIEGAFIDASKIKKRPAGVSTFQGREKY